ncbi:DUF1844 domain-containing protein [Candidatus Bathyarchaeota archaeon]|nr:DUF1844 domain-containing protein [Candidatus Bathyarchaeota archaeon]
MEPHKENEKVVDITSLDIYPLLNVFLNILGAQAWQYLGLRIRAGSDKIEKDLERARVAIDCIDFISTKIEPHLQDEEKQHLKHLVTDLQINFVRVQQT